MRKGIHHIFIAALVFGLLAPMHAVAQDDQTNQSEGVGAVFVMTNSTDKNEIIAFPRAADGTLQEPRRVSTGGRGSGGNTDPLESQGSLTLSQDHQLLFAVNAGSGELSVFRVHRAALSLADKVSSGGSEPNAIAQHGNLVYVLNAGGSSDVVGFRLDGDRLEEIPGSTRFLSTNTSGAASVAFSPNGRFLMVTERLTNKVEVFEVHDDGTLSSVVVNSSAGLGAFAIRFAPNGAALVSETGPAGIQNASAITSYAVLANGTLSAISTSVPTLGTANCWNAITPDGRFVYVSNAGSASISGFAIQADGTLTALPGTIVGTNPPGATNLDVAISTDGRFLYTLNTGNGTIGIFAIQKDGTLVNIGPAEGITPVNGFNGIAAD